MATTVPAREVPPEFWRKLAAATERVLMLDYDGTLAPFTVDRLQAVPYPGVREILSEIQQAGHTRLIFISGRLLKELLDLLQLESQPEAWGSHGIERISPDGRYETAHVPEESVRCLARAEQWARNSGYSERLECKTGSVVFHWRGLPEAEATRMRRDMLESLAPSLTDSLALREFDGGIELRLNTVDKGSAVNQVLAELGTNAVAAYLGDDLTDEDAFRAIWGHGLPVLVRDGLRETMAEIWIRPPYELLLFLQRWHEVSNRGEQESAT